MISKLQDLFYSLVIGASTTLASMVVIWSYTQEPFRFAVLTILFLIFSAKLGVTLRRFKGSSHKNTMFIVLACVACGVIFLKLYPWGSFHLEGWGFSLFEGVPYNLDNDVPSVNTYMGVVGDFFGGILGPILSFLTIMLLIQQSDDNSKREDARDWANKFNSEVLAAKKALNAISAITASGQDVFLEVIEASGDDLHTKLVMKDVARKLISVTYIVNNLYSHALKSVVSSQNDQSAFHYYYLRSQFDEIFIENLCLCLNKLKDEYCVDLPYSDKTLRALRKEQGAGKVFPDVTNLAAIQRIVDAAK